MKLRRPPKGRVVVPTRKIDLPRRINAEEHPRPRSCCIAIADWDIPTGQVDVSSVGINPGTHSSIRCPSREPGITVEEAIRRGKDPGPTRTRRTRCDT